MDRDQLLQACAALPLFPMPGTVLMPGASLPLHVYEQRYRDLVRNCLAGNGILAVPQIISGEEEAHLGRPSIYPYAGVGYIGAHDELPDGRYNVVVHPVARVRIFAEEEEGAYPYRVARAELLEDLPVPPGDVARVGSRVRSLFVPLIARMGAGGSVVARALMSLPAERVAEAIAPVVLQSDAARQDFLAENSPVERARSVELAVLTLVGEASTTPVPEA